MRNNFKKIISISILILICFLSQGRNVFASSVVLSSDTDKMTIGKEFYVDVMLDTKGESINGVQGQITFEKDKILFIRAEEGKSIINLFIDKPKAYGDTIGFSGIITSGFSGVIDPFNQKHKLNGTLLRLIFEAKSEGLTDINTKDFIITLNDGLGTTESVSPSKSSYSVSNLDNNIVSNTENDTNPEISSYVIQDPNLYGGKYVLIFDAKDKGSGIKDVKIKEGQTEWKIIVSPYLLEDQSRHSMVTLEATNYKGASIMVNVESLPVEGISTSFVFVFIILLILLILLMIKKIYEFKYKKN